MEVKAYKTYHKWKVKQDIIRILQQKDWLKQEKCFRNPEYMQCVYDIMQHPKFQKMEEFIQHGETTTLTHCLRVSYISYKISRSYRLDYRSTARAALLHDLFLYDWHSHARETGNYFHGFTHPRVALYNAEHYFNLNEKEKDIILKHMWPLTIVPPRYLEGYVVMYADKYCSLIETLGRIKCIFKKKKNN